VLKKTNKYTEGKTFVYFVRHGDREFHPDGGLWHPGPKLSKKGIKQAKSVAKKFSKIKDEIDVLYSSTMARAKETANEISKTINKKPIIIHEFSELEKVDGRLKVLNVKFWKEYFKFKKAEKVFNDILRKHKGKLIIIVAHAGMNKLLIGRKLGLSLKQCNKFDYHNCNISLVRFNGRKLDYVHCFNAGEIIKPVDPKSLRDKK